MMQLGAFISYPKLEGLDFGDILEVLRFHMDEIGDEVLDKIEARTPEWTGALKEDETWKPLRGDKGSLLQWCVGDDYQLTEWGRVYAPYQEGEPLGLHTYTNGPRHFLLDVQSADLPEIEAWALQTVQEAVDNVFVPVTFGGTP